MKKLFFLLFALALTGCTNSSSDSALSDVFYLNEPTCLQSYELAHFTEENSLEIFGRAPEYFTENLTKLFQNEEFLELRSKSTVQQLCISSDNASFLFYGEFGEFNNVVGLTTAEDLALSYQYNRGMGDIGLCRILGGMDGVLYSCGGGDGPYSFNKIFHLSPDGETKTLRDCTYSSENSDETVATCSVDLLGL